MPNQQCESIWWNLVGVTANVGAPVGVNLLELHHVQMVWESYNSLGYCEMPAAGFR